MLYVTQYTTAGLVTTPTEYSSGDVDSSTPTDYTTVGVVPTTSRSGLPHISHPGDVREMAEHLEERLLQMTRHVDTNTVIIVLIGL